MWFSQNELTELNNCGSANTPRRPACSVSVCISVEWIQCADSPHTPCSTCGKTPHSQTCSSGPGLPAASSPALYGVFTLTSQPLFGWLKKMIQRSKSWAACASFTYSLPRLSPFLLSSFFPVWSNVLSAVCDSDALLRLGWGSCALRLQMALIRWPTVWPYGSVSASLHPLSLDNKRALCIYLTLSCAPPL